MKIAVWHNLPSGGGKRALFYHIRGLAERGHTLKSWCPTTADQSYLPLSELIEERVLPLSWQPRAQKSFLGKLSTLKHDVLSRARALDEHCYRCAQEINAEGFDILFANSSLFQSVSAIGRYVRLPKVLYLQEPMRELYEAAPRLPWAALPPQERWWSPLSLLKYAKDAYIVQNLRVLARDEQLNAKAFDEILVNSYFSRESILRAYGLNAKVCYLGVDTEKFHLEAQPKEELVVGLGAFIANKNIGLIIEAMAEVKGPRPRLLWIGNASYPAYLEELKALAASLGVDFEPKVRVDDKELVSILNRARVMAYAPRLEPFGFAPLEANACGLPVVAVAEGGVKETIVDGVNGLLVESDAKAIGAAIERLLRNPEEAERLGMNGRKLVEERWSYSASVDRLEQRLKEIYNNAFQNH